MKELIQNTVATPSIKGRQVEGAALRGVLGMINTPEFSGDEGDGPFRPPSDPIPGTSSAPAPEKVQRPKPKMPVPAAAAPAPQEVHQLSQRIYTTGRLMVGKDHVLKSVGATIVGFADPLYAIQEYFFPGTTKTTDGARKFLQTIGQWGRGYVDETYPLTPERAIFTLMIRHYGMQGLLHNSVDWNTYGLGENIWLDALMKRAENLVGPLAVSNCRFDNEARYLDSAGWVGYHVMCSPKTLLARHKAAKVSDRDLNDFSEQLAIARDKYVLKTITAVPRGGKLRVIWNDPTEKCPSPRLWDFKNTRFLLNDPNAYQTKDTESAS